jgi:hypothetical protein
LRLLIPLLLPQKMHASRPGRSLWIQEGNSMLTEQARAPLRRVEADW